MRLTEFFLCICLLFILSLCISCKTSFPKKYPSQATTRIYLQMPKLVDRQKIKSEFPINELKKMQMDAKEHGYAMSPLNYSFKIDKTGNILDGRINVSNNKPGDTVNSYFKNKFITYKWYPAYYSHTNERLTALVEMSIYSPKQNDIFEVSFRLIYLPDKENIQDIVSEKNLISRFRIR